MNSHKHHGLLDALREAMVFRALKDQRQHESSSFFSSVPGLQALCCRKPQLNIAVTLQAKMGSVYWHVTFHTPSLSLSIFQEYG